MPEIPISTVGACHDCGETLRWHGLASADGALDCVGIPPVHRPECQWFALCERLATTTIPHPILGPVPTCADCQRKYEET